MPMSDINPIQLVSALVEVLPSEANSSMAMGLTGQLGMASASKLPMTETRQLAAKLGGALTVAAAQGQDTFVDKLSESTADMVMHFVALASVDDLSEPEETLHVDQTVDSRPSTSNEVSHDEAEHSD